MPAQASQQTLDWSTPLTWMQALKLLLACWLGDGLMSLSLMFSTAFCAGFAMTILTMGGGGIPALPKELALQTATFIWDDFSQTSGYRFLSFTLGFAGIAVPLLICLRLWKVRINLPSVFGPGAAFGVRHLTIALTTTMAIWAWQALAAGNLSRYTPLHYENKQVEILSLAQTDSAVGLTALMLSCSIFPLLEEILFRGIIYRVCRRYMAVPASVAASALLFGFWHFNPGRLWLFVHTAGIGVLLALSYEVTGCLWVPIIGHVFNNILVFFNNLV